MKKLFKSVFILCLSFATLIGCSKDNTENFDALESQDNSLYNLLLERGYLETSIEDKGDYYLAEGDIVFQKNEDYGQYANREKKTITSKASSRQNEYPYPVNINDINVYINPGMSSNWILASKTAIANWNSVENYNGDSICLNLNEVTDPNDAHIKIMYDTHDLTTSLTSTQYGYGDYPTINGLPGKRTLINPDLDFESECSGALEMQWNRIANVQHELGHNLGLQHTNSSSGWTIPNTPEFATDPDHPNFPESMNPDPDSIMNTPAACTINGFSHYDEIAINYLFPTCPTCPDAVTVLISGPNYMPSGTNHISWAYNGGVTNVQSYKWWYKKTGTNGNPYVIGHGQNLLFFAGPDTIYSIGRNSYFEIYLEVIDANGCSYTSDTFSILKKGKWKHFDN